MYRHWQKPILQSGEQGATMEPKITTCFFYKQGTPLGLCAEKSLNMILHNPGFPLQRRTGGSSGAQILLILFL